MNKNPILTISNLSIDFRTDRGVVPAVRGLNLTIPQGKAVGIVGESGCGKSVTSYSILRLLPDNARISGSIRLLRRTGEFVDVVAQDPNGRVMRSIRGEDVAIVFQEPMTALSPVHTIGLQITESIRAHRDIGKQDARAEAINLMTKVGIRDASTRVDDYPFKYSGGMRQRAMIAMALAANPRLLVADEPTTALDVTVQGQVLSLIRQLQRTMDLSLLLITHDLGVIAHMVDYVYVMYLGRIVEEGPVTDIFDSPAHPYTRDLLRSIPTFSRSRSALLPISGSVPDAANTPVLCQHSCRMFFENFSVLRSDGLRMTTGS